MLYTLKKNGQEMIKKPYNRAACLVRLERARSQAVIAGLTYTWKGNALGARMTISNGDTWEMNACSQ